MNILIIVIHHIYLVQLRLSKSAATVLKQAELDLRNGNEEESYVLHMKYFNLVQLVRKAKDYEKNRGQVRELLGSNDNMTSRMDRLSDLKTTLKKR